ncbi:Redoxin-domain-containing protein [Scheffersomyces xylosifermentans]|uniref:Redoxin-domain-containing protein n=1 Tax=Scheffersomyces xylosifermentans TaxID=1304137 RepID=UPI00315D0F57
MPLEVTEKFPSNVEFQYIPINIDEVKEVNVLKCEIPTLLKLDKLFESLAGTNAPNVLIVAVPGAFTPTCTENHIPPFLTHLTDLKKDKKIGAVIIIATNDAFVINAWGKLLIKDALAAQPNFSAEESPKIIFASDVNGAFSKAYDLASDKGTGIRTSRYATVVNSSDRTVKYFGVEVERGVKFSGLDAILGAKL